MHSQSLSYERTNGMMAPPRHALVVEERKMKSYKGLSGRLGATQRPAELGDESGCWPFELRERREPKLPSVLVL